MKGEFGGITVVIEPGLTYYCRTGDGERARAVKMECA